MRNGVRVEEDSNHTTSQIIVDTSVNTVFNNTLRVRERETGEYKCDVRSNYQHFFPDISPGWSVAASTLVVRGKAMQLRLLLSCRRLCARKLPTYWFIIGKFCNVVSFVLCWKTCVCVLTFIT